MGEDKEDEKEKRPEKKEVGNVGAAYVREKERQERRSLFISSSLQP